MPEVNGCIFVCGNCSRLPREVAAAEVIGIRPSTARDYLAEDSWSSTIVTQGAERYVDSTVQVVMEATQVIDTHQALVKKGDIAIYGLFKAGRDIKQIRDAFKNCDGPYIGWLGRIMARIGVQVRGKCGVGESTDGYRHAQFSRNIISR